MTARRKRSLRDLLVIDVDEVAVVATDEYRIAGVYGSGRGLFERGTIRGGETSYKKLNRLHPGRLVVSRLKAFEGALAIIPEAFDDWFLSPEFPTFRCIEGELEPSFFAHVCRWPEFWSMLAATSKGIGARRERVDAEGLLRLELSIPPIDEQRRIADRLDRLQTAAAELARRSERGSQLMGALAVSASSRPDLDEREKTRAGWRRVALGSVMTQAIEQVLVEPLGSYPNAGIYSFGRGLFKKPDIDGATTSASSLNRIHAGQFIYSRLFAFEGAYSYVPPEFEGFLVSSEFPTFDTDPVQLDARWLANYLRSSERWRELGGSSKGLGVRRQRVPVDAMLAYEVWIPSIEDQHVTVAAIDRIDRSRISRERLEQRLGSLIPAALNQVFAGIS